jgi:hypothetical protein
MTTQEINVFLRDVEPPFIIKTTGGRSYEIPARANFWVPDPYPGMLCVALNGKGVIVIRTSSIESVELDSSPETAHPADRSAWTRRNAEAVDAITRKHGIMIGDPDQE